MQLGLASILADCGAGFSCHLAKAAETLTAMKRERENTVSTLTNPDIPYCPFNMHMPTLPAPIRK
jgi:hypothetical protein